MSKHTHSCECKHSAVSYCATCKVVHCSDCKQEWVTQPVYNYSYRPGCQTYQTTGNSTLGQYGQNTLTMATSGTPNSIYDLVCKHTNDAL